MLGRCDNLERTDFGLLAGLTLPTHNLQNCKLLSVCIFVCVSVCQ